MKQPPSVFSDPVADLVVDAAGTPLPGPSSDSASVDVLADDVLGCDGAVVLGFLVEQQRREDAAAAAKLRAVAHWADLHPSGVIVGAVDDAVWTEFHAAPRLGLEGELRLAGQGAASVAEFAVCELAAALRLSEPAARRLVGEALELRDRLPRLWGRVMAGDLPAWKARLVAAETIRLNAAAADFVDAHLAPFAHQVSWARVDRAVAAAMLRHDPAAAAEAAAKAAEKRGVWVEDNVDGTSSLQAIADTPDAHALDAALDSVASTLGRLGDTDPHQVRRAKALGVLADPQYALDLTTSATTAEEGRGSAPAAGGGTGLPSGGRGTVFHIHVHTGLATNPETADLDADARVEGVGTVALAGVERWLTRLGLTDTMNGSVAGPLVKVTPVVDLAAHLVADGYTPSTRLADQIRLRDRGCVFPWCGREGRHDLDHTTPYLPRDEGGMPGQTNSQNLTRLCRFHHRVKTHGGWTYQHDPEPSPQTRRDPGDQSGAPPGSVSVTWTSPLGRRYTVSPTGTIPHDRI